MFDMQMALNDQHDQNFSWKKKFQLLEDFSMVMDMTILKGTYYAPFY